ncbi:MAG: glycosyltransferase family 39 protein, partial [Candidatus Levybacteria bacterium]|nr:glycosyltransferase family 39 protein [Candidatus Levybacteria bacterium]
LFFIPLSVAKIIFTNLDALLKLISSPPDFFLEYKDIIFGNRLINAMYWSRIITAIFGTGTVFLLYLVGKKLFTKEVGLFSAFFLAVNYLHVLRSHFGLPDVYNGFFALLSLYVSALILEKDTRKRYLLAGFIIGIGFAIKYQIFLIIPFVIAHGILAFRRKSILYFFNKNAFYAGFVFLAAFLLINPYYLFNITEAMRMNRIDVLRYKMGVMEFQHYSYFYLYNWGVDKLPSLMVVIGIIAMLFRNTFRFILVFPFAFVFMFFMTYYSQGGIFPRNFATVVPYLMLFAGYGTWILWKFLKHHINVSAGKILIVVFIFIASASSIKNSFILGENYSLPWSETILSGWLNNKMPKDSVVRSYNLYLHNASLQAIKDKNAIFKDWDYVRGPNSVAEFQEEGTQFAILNTNPLQSITYWWKAYPQLYMNKDRIPFEYIENGFQGLIVRELLNYTVFETHKPWQAHYNDNYLVFKIPQKPLEIGERIAYYGFDDKKQDIKIRGSFGFDTLSFSWDQDEGKRQKGSLLVNFGETSTSRLALAPVRVKPGKYYTFKGFIKSKQIPETEPEGFLRIDFYDSNGQKTLDQMGMSVAVSNRAKTSGEWEEVSGGAVAPKNAEYVTVSFQFKGHQTSSFVDDIEIFESDVTPQEQFRDVPYVVPTIPIESLYYNSFI